MSRDVSVHTHGACYNSGVMVLRPSTADFHAMLKLLARPSQAAARNGNTTYEQRLQLSACVGETAADSRAADTDQDFIQLYFQSRECLLDMPPLFNTMMVTQRTDLVRQYFSSVFLTWVFSTPATRRLVYAFHVSIFSHLCRRAQFSALPLSTLGRCRR